MDKKLAVLIDGDNIPSAYVKEMMEEIAKYGNPTIKRIYGDWTNPGLNKWKAVLLENAITPIQQYAYTKGKNATDSAMIIDAMDVLYTKNVDGFCIVSKMAKVFYHLTNYYNPEEERCIQWNDEELGIDWPLQNNPLVSDKDKKGKKFKDSEYFE